jgi:hypothetical protein
MPTAAPGPQALGADGDSVYFCSLGFGNLTCLANDPVVAPQLEGPEGRAGVGAPNAVLVVLLAGGLPVPFVVTTGPIPAKGEVLIAYGDKYWGAWRMLRRGGGGA